MSRQLAAVTVQELARAFEEGIITAEGARAPLPPLGIERRPGGESIGVVSASGVAPWIA